LSFITIPPPLRSTLFPYTTLFRSQVVLETMRNNNVKYIVFSSTAATYGEPKQVPITEDMPTVPTNTYGETKLAMEKMMKWSEIRSEEHTSELQSRENLVCRLLLEK